MDNYIFAYYQQIKDGTTVVSKWVRRTYELIIAGIENGVYTFNAKKANNAIEWIEKHCFHVEGELAPNPLELQLWQKAMLSCIFGICGEDGRRQFREVLLVIGRKNGKSLLSAAVMNYIFRQDGGFGTRVYRVAPKLDQADIVYEGAWAMIQLDPASNIANVMVHKAIEAKKYLSLFFIFFVNKIMTNKQIPKTNNSK